MEHPPGKATEFVAYVTLMLLGLLAFLTLHADISNYISSVRSVRGLSLSIVDIKVIDDNNPRALLRFNLTNQSPLEIELESYRFDLFLKDKLIGGSHFMYRGTNPDADPGEYIKAQTINQSLKPNQTLNLAFTLYIYRTKMSIIRNTQKNREIKWQVKADFTVFLPNSRKKSHVKLNARYEK